MVKYYLDKRGSGEAPIILSLQYKGKRIKAYTGKKISADKWDAKTCRANPRKYKTEPTEFNNWLTHVSNEVQSHLNRNNGIARIDVIKIMSRASGLGTEETFFGFANSYIESQVKKGDLKESTARACKVSMSHLRDFSPNLRFSDVNLDFRDRFIIKLRDKGLMTNSIGGHIKKLKWIMNAALDRDLHTNRSFKKKSFSVPKEESDQVYLTRKEIAQFSKYKLSESHRRVADTFVLNCSLGMRFADLPQIKESNFVKHGNDYQLHMIQAKGNQKVVIPIPREALTLLRKYKFTCPVFRNDQMISVQKFNEYLKEAAQACKLNSIRQIKVGSEVDACELSKLIRSHTARRSFATNLYLDGIPTQQIMAVTGHKREETFLLYIRADQLSKAQGLEKHYRDKERKTVMKINRDAA